MHLHKIKHEPRVIISSQQIQFHATNGQTCISDKVLKWKKKETGLYLFRETRKINIWLLLVIGLGELWMKCQEFQIHLKSVLCSVMSHHRQDNKYRNVLLDSENYCVVEKSNTWLQMSDVPMLIFVFELSSQLLMSRNMSTRI